MKIWYIVLGIWILYLIFNSATPSEVVVTTHKVFMNKFKTKNDVIKEFGLPDSKKELNGYEEWLFKKDKVIIRNKSKSGSSQNLTLGGGALLKNKYPIGGFNSNGGNFEDENETIREERSFLKFIFENDKVINWETVGLDFTKTS